MTDLSDEALDRIEALAMKATPGPWNSAPNTFEMPVVWSSDSTPIAESPMCRTEDSDFIAAASPDVVLALVAALREARRERDAYRRATGYDDPDALDSVLGRSGIDTHLDVLNRLRLDAERERDERPVISRDDADRMHRWVIREAAEAETVAPDWVLRCADALREHARGEHG